VLNHHENVYLCIKYIQKCKVQQEEHGYTELLWSQIILSWQIKHDDNHVTIQKDLILIFELGLWKFLLHSLVIFPNVLPHQFLLPKGLLTYSNDQPWDIAWKNIVYDVWEIWDAVQRMLRQLPGVDAGWGISLRNALAEWWAFSCWFHAASQMGQFDNLQMQCQFFGKETFFWLMTNSIWSSEVISRYLDKVSMHSAVNPSSSPVNDCKAEKWWRYCSQSCVRAKIIIKCKKAFRSKKESNESQRRIIMQVQMKK